MKLEIREPTQPLINAIEPSLPIRLDEMRLSFYCSDLAIKKMEHYYQELYDHREFWDRDKCELEYWIKKIEGVKYVGDIGHCGAISITVDLEYKSIEEVDEYLVNLPHQINLAFSNYEHYHHAVIADLRLRKKLKERDLKLQATLDEIRENSIETDIPF